MSLRSYLALVTGVHGLSLAAMFWLHSGGRAILSVSFLLWGAAAIIGFFLRPLMSKQRGTEYEIRALSDRVAKLRAELAQLEVQASKLKTSAAGHELTKMTGHKSPRMVTRHYRLRAQDLAKKLS
jgi:hypothetical protein